MTHSEESIEPLIDTRRPSPARIYDYFLGGKDNFAQDRMAANEILDRLPEAAALARANRRFHQRAVRYMARTGIRQFLDIGCGLPTMINTHQAAQQAAGGGEVRVAYADNDVQVVTHARALLAWGRPNVTVIRGDLRTPATILGAPQLADIIRPGEPTGLLMTAVLHFVSGEDQPHKLVREYADWLAPGSYLALSHGCESEPGKVTRWYERATEQAYSRTPEQILAFLCDLEIVPPYEGGAPGIAPVTRWAGDGQPAIAAGGSDPADTLWCGIGRKTA